MTKQEAAALVATSTVTPRGDAWGDPLWTVSVPNGTVDVHAADEVEAREKAAQFLVVTAE